MTDVGTDPQVTADEAIEREAVEHLESLAAELAARDYHASLVTAAGRRPLLHVRNRAAGILVEDVIIEAGWFWYSWCERIAPVTDIPEAAGKIARVLRAVDSR